jgi:hypothetical protein
MKDRKLTWILVALSLLAIGLAASGLAGQDNTVITVNDTTVVNIFDNDSTFIFIEQAPRDSAAIARDEAAQRSMDAIAEYLATCGCTGGGSANTTTKIAVAILIPALLWIGWELRGIKNKDDIHNVENNVDVDVNVPERKKKHGES